MSSIERYKNSAIKPITSTSHHSLSLSSFFYRQNFHQVCDIIADYIPSVLQRFFKKRVMTKCSYQWDDTQTSGRWMMEEKKWVTNKHLYKAQVDLVNKGNTSKWDITLLCRVLLCPNLPDDDQDHLCDQPQREAIIHLRDLRNKKFGHMSTNKTPDEEFTDLIAEVISSFRTIGGTFEDIAGFVVAIIKSGMLNIFLTHALISTCLLTFNSLLPISVACPFFTYRYRCSGKGIDKAIKNAMDEHLISKIRSCVEAQKEKINKWDDQMALEDIHSSEVPEQEQTGREQRSLLNSTITQ